jgi:cytochrome b6-f complex iron-sulfur subunit
MATSPRGNARSGGVGVSRRTILRSVFALGLGGTAIAIGGMVIDFLTPRTSELKGIVSAGSYLRYPPGSKTYFHEGKFWLVNLAPEEGGPGFLALSEKCPHLGCKVDWRDDYAWQDGTGWFYCDCHQSIFDNVGVRVFGPSPRAMDRKQIEFSAGGQLLVDSTKVSKGTTDNARFAVMPPE